MQPRALELKRLRILNYHDGDNDHDIGDGDNDHDIG